MMSHKFENSLFSKPLRNFDEKIFKFNFEEVNFLKPFCWSPVGSDFGVLVLTLKVRWINYAIEIATRKTDFDKI